MRKKTDLLPCAEQKQKLIELVKDIPWHADLSCEYIYSFVAFSMLKGIVAMSKGHQNEIENYCAEYRRKKEQKQIEKKEEKTELSVKDKLLCSSVNMLCEIKSEEVQEYLNTVIKNAFEEVRNGK